MMRWLAGVCLAILVLATGEAASARQAASQDVTGAWDVTITLSSGRTATGLAILSQDDSTITGMIGPEETEMMPVSGSVEGGKVMLLTRPRTGRTAAFAKAELSGTADRLTGVIDTDKGTIELVRKQRPNQPSV